MKIIKSKGNIERRKMAVALEREERFYIKTAILGAIIVIITVIM